MAMPTGQVLRWHLRIMMQPIAISGAVANLQCVRVLAASAGTSYRLLLGGVVLGAVGDALQAIVHCLANSRT